MKAPLQARAESLRRELVEHLYQTALAENWGPVCLFAGWVHLAVFAACYYLSSVQGSHVGGYYLALWTGEAAVVLASYALAARGSRIEPSPLAGTVKRIALAFLVLAANIAVLNHALGFQQFVLLPVLASLGSFSFLMLILLVSWRFLGALLLMFASGWAMARQPSYAYLIHGAVWWIVLERIGMVLCVGRLRQLRAAARTALEGAAPERRGSAEAVSEEAGSGALLASS